ncbi:jouberin isoform 2-T2 [Spinachia spinachia]
MQQQIFRQSDEHFEVYTTVFSPQMCRSGTRTGIRDRTGSRSRDVEAEKVVVVMQHRSSWQKELDLNQGDLVQVLFKEDQAWCFGQRSDGNEGYFPAACVEPLQGGDSSRAPPMFLRRGSVPVAMTTEAAPSGGTSLRQHLGLDGKLAVAPPPLGSPSLLHRVLAKSRRKSCPHLPHSPPDSGSINTAFQLD